MNTSNNKETEEALAKISKDRNRTNILKKYEQHLLATLVQRIPSWINSDMLTAIGFAGSIIVALSFVFAAYFDRYFLLLGILGFAINWFGDSLDGRIAYYRNTPRKWYGFSLDITVDWLTDILIGIGFMVYVQGRWELIGFAFVTLYGWAMIMALLRYKIVNKYTIDSSFLGPTEVRIILCVMLLLEVFVKGTINYFGAIACAVLLVINIIDFRKLLKMADQQDVEERQNRA
ncbi:MAG: CDP-alcohol phosphatidyltransferase family protein [Dysgonomonas sp.]